MKDTIATQQLSTRDRAVQYFESLAPGPAKSGEATEAVPTFTPRPVRIIAIGAGLAGLSMARAVNVGKIRNAVITVYEKDGDVGGTWYENRYPGCACDIPAPNYQFSWAPNPFWKSYYASQGDILSYIKSVADQHELRPCIKTSHKVVNAVWLPDREVWQVTVTKTDGRDLVISSPGVSEGETSTTFTEECDILVDCTGFFNHWKWPHVKGRTKFQGRMLHSAAWPQDSAKDIKGKTVALIGNGSSGVQILPAIFDEASKVYVHIRSPTLITTNFASKFAGPGGLNYDYSEEQKASWAADPEEYLKYRRGIEEELNSRFGLYIDHSPEQKAAREYGIQEMTDKLGGKQDLLKALLPDFAVGCRRPTPGNGYLEALVSPKVEVVWGTVDAFTSDGICSSSGQTTTGVDTIICATGFDLSSAPRFPIVGLNGTDLRQLWLENPRAYLSVTATDMPNYFRFLGPYSPLGHGSLVTSIEMVTKYISDFINKLQTQNYSYRVPKAHIPAAYQKQALAWLSKTAWASHCTSTYKNGTADGDLNSLHPGSRIHYFELLRTPRWEDFEWKSLCDSEDLTFAWLANGFTDKETNPTKDTNST
ncbi:cyclohexanone monooxygenase [Thelonectria olida]|uniref:Cyclohexanone monooxygenase n=1 Tax=Thelonectria olida TaxID=1576542 RepID=A0A9P8VRJ4_9HYPO|nr:cyclohexanone monooxygenase [Thelonectria olida]